ncbi:MAG: hypothetical protein ACLPZM_03880 [Thermoplasmata archaeon]
MARPGVSLGVLGAVLIMVGLVLFGIGLLVESNAEQTEINCIYGGNPSNCQATDSTAANTSVDAVSILGTGLIVAGVGAAMTVIAMLGIMTTRLETPPPMMMPTSPSVPPGSTAPPPSLPPSYPPPPAT